MKGQTMSAWIVSKGHIDCLVQAMIFEGIVPMDQASAAGQALWRENLNSLKYRYPNDGDGERPGPTSFRDGDVDTYKFEGVEAPLDDLIVWTQLNCYDYQTCEHPEWRDDATLLPAQWCWALSMAYEMRYGANDKKRGPWGIDDIREAIKASVES